MTFTETFAGAKLNETANWRSEPQYRGTFGLLSTCFLTLFLCVWSSIHLNVPDSDQKRPRLISKFGWLTMALLAPEIVLYTAWRQCMSTRRLHKTAKTLLPKLNTKRGQVRKGIVRSSIKFVRKKMIRPLRQKIKALFARKPENDKSDSVKSASTRCPEIAEPALSPRVHNWTHTHSFLVTMGGLAFSAYDEAGERFIPGDVNQWIRITPAGVRFLMEREPELLRAISQTEIMDKSKANGLVKFITVCQTSWFGLQCLFRLVEGLVVSPLEINTLGHVICAIAMNAMWWNKLLDVETPVLITDKKGTRLAALFYMVMADEPGITQMNTEANSEADERSKSGSPRPATATSSKSSSSSSSSSSDSSSDTASQMELETPPPLAAPEKKAVPSEKEILKQSIGIVKDPKDADFISPVAPTVVTLAGTLRGSARYTSEFAVKEAGSKSTVELPSPTSPARDTLKDLPFGLSKELPPLPSVDGSSNSQLQTSTPEPQHSPEEIRRFKYAAEALKEYNLTRQSIKDLGNLVDMHKVRDTAVFSHIVDLDFEKSSRIFNDPVMLLATVLYGTLHLLAWNAAFRTHNELIMWRVAGIFITASTPIFSIMDYITPKKTKTHHIFKRYGSTLYRLEPGNWRNPRAWAYYWSSRLLMRWEQVSSALPIAVTLLFCIYCRLFLFFEAVYTVPFLPNRVYELPRKWDRWMPTF